MPMASLRCHMHPYMLTCSVLEQIKRGLCLFSVGSCDFVPNASLAPTRSLLCLVSPTVEMCDTILSGENSAWSGADGVLALHGKGTLLSHLRGNTRWDAAEASNGCMQDCSSCCWWCLACCAPVVITCSLGKVSANAGQPRASVHCGGHLE